MAITSAMVGQVTELYTSLFGRAPESDGLGYWVSRLGKGDSVTLLANEMYNVSAARVIYPLYLTNEQIIGKFYTNVLGRTADATGLAFWTAKLNASGASVGDVVVQMIASVNTYSGTDAAGLASQALFQNKVAAGTYYATNGGNSITNTVLSLVSATSTAATVNAAIAAVINPPVVVAPLNSTLTINLDSVTGGATDDTITAFISGTASTSTLTGGDQINGAGGNDTLSILIDTNTAANTMAPALTSIENVTVRNLSAAANLDELSLVQATGVTNVTLTNSLSGGNLAVTNAPLAATYAISATPAAAAGSVPAQLAVTINSAELLGTADVVNFSVTGAGSKIGNAAADRAVLEVTNTSGVEKVSVATSGVNYITVNGAGTDTATITVTGNGTNNISTADTNATTLLDASSSTGANTFTLAATLTSADTVKGGSGLDVLSITLADASAVSVSGVETLRIEQASTNNANLAFAANPAFTTIEMRESTNSVALTGISGNTSLAFVGADNTPASTTYTKGNATDDVSFGTVQFNTVMSGAADVMTMSLGNQGVTASTAYAAGIKASGIETINIVQSDKNSSATSTYTVTDTGLKTLTVTDAGIAAVTLDTRASSAPNYSGTTSTTYGNSLSLVDLSGVVGTATLSGSLAGAYAATSELRTAQGGMTYTFGTETNTDVITVTGNAGVDTITTGSAGTFIANLNAGNDIFSAAAIAVAGDGTVNVNGGAGDDSITGGVNADTLIGGDGADTLVGGKGADMLDGGTGADTIRETVGAAAAAGTNQVSTVTPVGLGTGEYLNVTIGGTVYSTVFDTDLPKTLGNFVTAYATTIRGVTGGVANGLILTANGTGIATGTATELVITATGTHTESNGVTTPVGYSFTAPVATVTTGLNSGAAGGYGIVNAYSSYVVTPNADFNTAADVFTITVGTTTKTVTYDTSVSNSLTLFALANPTIGGLIVEPTATALNFYRTSTDSATTAAATALTFTSAAGTGASAATVSAATDLTITDTVAAIDYALPGVSTSSYLVTGAGLTQVITNTMDTIAYVQGDIIDFTSANITKADVSTTGAARATIAATGIATFDTTTPGNLGAALDQIAAAMTITAETLGESAIFQFGGTTYLYVSDGVAGHSAADLVIQITGVPTLVTGLSLSGGDIIGIS